MVPSRFYKKILSLFEKKCNLWYTNNETLSDFSEGKIVSKGFITNH